MVREVSVDVLREENSNRLFFVRREDEDEPISVACLELMAISLEWSEPEGTA
jgi:hypothetical protein